MPDIVATPEPHLARVLLEVSGGTPGEVFYIFRRDADGVDIVRDTSEGTAGYPQITPLRRNLVTNPVPVGTTGWYASGTGVVSGAADGGPLLLGLTNGSQGAFLYEGGSGSAAHPVNAGEVVHMAATVRPNLPGSWRIRTRLDWSVNGTAWTGMTYQTVTGSGPSENLTVEATETMPPTAKFVRLSIDVYRLQARNFLPDGSWEKGLTVWESTPNLEVSATTDWATDGIQSVIATMVGTPADAYVGIPGATIVSPEYLGPLVVGEWIGWGGDVYSPGATRGFAARIVFTNASGATVGTSPFGAFVGSGGRAVVSAQVPTGAVRAFIRLHLYGTATGTGFLPLNGSIRTDAWTLVRAADSAAALAAAGTYTPPWDAVPNALEVSNVLLESTAGGMRIGGPFFPPQAQSLEVACTWSGARHNSPSVQWRDGSAVRTNLAMNPRGVGRPWGLAGGTGVQTDETTGGPLGFGYRKVVLTGTTTSSPIALQSGGSGTAASPVVEGRTYTFSAYARMVGGSTAAVTNSGVSVTWYTAAGASISSDSTYQGALVDGVWTRHAKTLVAPPGAAFALMFERFSISAGLPPVGSEYGAGAFMIEEAATALEYFDGDTPPSGALRASSWEGAANASSSVWGSYAVAPIYDHEAQQGTTVTYLLTNPDGVTLAMATVDLPLWGTWLKSPGRPFRNTRCHFGHVAEIVAPLAREVYDVEESGQVVVYSAKRAADRSGELVLVTRSLAQLEALRRLLSDGSTLLLDTPPRWNVGFRYISVGDVARERPLSMLDGFGNLESEARLWKLADVVTVESPQGVSQGDPGRTYGSLPVLFATYTAIPATTATYEELATGVAF